LGLDVNLIPNSIDIAQSAALFPSVIVLPADRMTIGRRCKEF
jgi:hypothetical protein